MTIIPLMQILNHKTKECFWWTTNPERTQFSLLLRNKLGSSELKINKNGVERIETIRGIDGKDLEFKTFYPALKKEC